MNRRRRHVLRPRRHRRRSVVGDERFVRRSTHFRQTSQLFVEFFETFDVGIEVRVLASPRSGFETFTLLLLKARLDFGLVSTHFLVFRVDGNRWQDLKNNLNFKVSNSILYFKVYILSFHRPTPY